MPVRIIDGTAWSRSRKIKDGVDEKYRIHYLAWLTLPKPNGTFECDLEQIHADLYAFLYPSIKLKHVRDMFSQFISAGILVTWKEKGKTWGFFPGSEKSGRHISKEHLKRYKDLPPTYPGLFPEESGNVPEGVRFGVGVGLGMGKGLEEEMGLKDNLADKCEELLHVRPMNNDPDWSKITEYAKGNNSREKRWALVDSFEQFVRSREGTEISHPLREFAAYLKGGKPVISVPSTPEDDAGKALAVELAVIANDVRVFFTPQQAASLSRLLSSHAVADIKSVFREFINERSNDAYLMSRSGRDFINAVEQLLAVQARRREKERKTQEMLRASTENEQRKAEEELATRLKEEADLQDLIEDTL